MGDETKWCDPNSRENFRPWLMPPRVWGLLRPHFRLVSRLTSMQVRSDLIIRHHQVNL